jgi:hypothetical protein
MRFCQRRDGIFKVDAMLVDVEKALSFVPSGLGENSWSENKVLFSALHQGGTPISIAYIQT